LGAKISAITEFPDVMSLGLALKNFNSKSYIQLIDWQAQKAEVNFVNQELLLSFKTH